MQALIRALHSGLQLMLGLAIFVGAFIALLPAELGSPAAGTLSAVKLRFGPAPVRQIALDAPKAVRSGAATPPQKSTTAAAPPPTAAAGRAETPDEPSALPAPAPSAPETTAQSKPDAEATTATTPAAGGLETMTLPRAVAIDSATLVSGASRVRIAGLSAIDPSRQCSFEGARWPCGAKARTALRNWLRARSLQCTVPSDFFLNRLAVEADCKLGSEDVGEWLARNGWAEAAENSRYSELQDEAKKAGLGVWGNGR